MDLSFARHGLDGTATDLPGDLAILMAGIAVRQASSPTAMLGASAATPLVASGLLCPAHGAFNRTMAATICQWQQE